MPPDNPRAMSSRAAMVLEWVARGLDLTLEQTRGDLTLVLEQEPKLIPNLPTFNIGLDARVRLYHATLGEIPIDGHRIFINPPLQVEDLAEPPRVINVGHGSNATTVELPGLRVDAGAAFWEMLWDTVLNHPHQEGWL